MADSPDHSKDNLVEKADGAKDTHGKGKVDVGGKDKPATDKEKGKGDKQTSSQRGSLTKPNITGIATPMGMPQQKPTLRYMPNYRLEPKNPLKKEWLEIAMKDVMNKNYHNEYMFHPKHSLHLAAQVSEEIKNRIKLMNYDRYRYIVLVTVGENLMQGLYAMVNFLWDAEKDGFVSHTIETPRFFALCTVYYIYYD
ncbi:tctex1 domain-containing protein 1 [Scaptodrosophila lebanonensis]|uniref:Tctex1 domain-containing protein 1 n=1 Tax=Drosophila lebanonensis TaxID=7225 RepID=A0A6J2UJJ0_DROLE|nr:tctex1 domain-containing protein 1 [Scaptodrosophila lebanonensis]